MKYEAFHTNLYGKLDYFIVSALVYVQHNYLGCMSKRVVTPIGIGHYREKSFSYSEETVVRALDGEILIISKIEHPFFSSQEEFKTALRRFIKDISSNFSDDEELFIQPAENFSLCRFADFNDAKKRLLKKQLSVNDIYSITFFEKTSFDEMNQLKITLHDFDNAYTRLTSSKYEALDPFKVEQRRCILKETLNFIDYLHETSWGYMVNKMSDFLNLEISNPDYSCYTIFDGIIDIMVKNFKNLKNAESEILCFIDEEKRGKEDASYLTYDWFYEFFKTDTWKNFISVAKMLNSEDRFPSYMNILYNAQIYHFILL